MLKDVPLYVCKGSHTPLVDHTQPYYLNTGPRGGIIVHLKKVTPRPHDSIGDWDVVVGRVKVGYARRAKVPCAVVAVLCAGTRIDPDEGRQG